METRHGSNQPWSGLAWNQRYVPADGPKFDPFRPQMVVPPKTKSPDPCDSLVDSFLGGLPSDAKSALCGD